MKSDFLNKFSVGVELFFNNMFLEIINKKETESFYDLDMKDSAGKQLEISLKNKSNENLEDFLLIFIDDEKIVYNKRKKKLNVNLDKNFLELLNKLKEKEKIKFEKNIFELKNIVKSEIKDGSNTYPSINYILVSYINEKEKFSLSIFKCNNTFTLNSCEIKHIDKKEIQFI